MTKQRTTRRAAAIGLTAGLIGGGAAGMVFGVPGLTGAAPPAQLEQTDEPTDSDTDTDTDSDTDTTTGSADADDAERLAARTERIRELLDELVAAGTIDESQADAVAGHLAEQAPERGPRGGGHHIGFGSEVLSEVLGIEPEELREQLRDGQTVAEIAAANGVEVQAVVDALVAHQAERLAEAVEDGRLDADRAAEIESELAERVTDAVNGEGPLGGGRHGGPRGGGGGATDAEPGGTTPDGATDAEGAALLEA